MTVPPEQATSGLSRDSLVDIAKGFPDVSVRGVERILHAVRSHLGMDVAFVSEFVGKQRYFRHVDTKGGKSPIKVGDSMPLTDGYCLRVVDGLLPQLIADTAHVPEAMALPETRSVPIGSHLSVPIRLKDGRVYGTFCCFSHTPDQSLNQRDLLFMRAFAEVAAFQIEHEMQVAALRSEGADRITAAIERRQPAIVYQPMVSLADLRVVGVECLARFEINPFRGPAAWFAEAATVGRGPKLEVQAIDNAIAGLRALTIAPDIAIWLNLSAATILSEDLASRFGRFAPGRIVLEVTEHDHVEDYGELEHALEPLRQTGVRVAIDDAGAGYASMAHILNIAPDFIKLDLSLTRQIDRDRKRRALAAALVEFGRQTDCRIVAEGVESGAELNALRALGAHMAQGFFISEPVTPERLEEAVRQIDHDARARPIR